MTRARCACSSPASLVPPTRPATGSKLVFLLDARMDGEKMACSSRSTPKRRFGRNNTLPFSSATVASAARVGGAGSAQLACARVDRRLNFALRPPRGWVGDPVESRRYQGLLRLLDADLTRAAP